MKRILILSTITAASLFATNGANLIGLGAESRALGGTGIAMYQGSENAMSNPALLGKTKSDEKEFTIAATIFKADVSAKTTNGANMGGGAPGVDESSDSGVSVIPYIAHAHRLSESLTFGFGLYGIAGMGVDYTGQTVNPGMGQTKLYNMKSALEIMQLAPSLAYNKDNYGVGVTAIAQYGSLQIDYDGNPGNGTMGVNHIGDNDSSSDTGFGLQIGGFYNMSDSTTLAAVYKSAIDMEYGTEISDAATAFGYGNSQGGMTPLEAKSDHLEQPAEMGVGFATTQKTMTYTVDYKVIKWSDAKGYKDFGWEDQKVIALGAKYSTNSYWLGVGYNSANNPVPNSKNTTSVAGGQNTDGDTMNVFNYVMFPGTITKAYTFGGGYNLSKTSSLDLAYTHMPEVSDTVSGATVGVGNLTTTHSQKALTIAYKFNY